MEKIITIDNLVRRGFQLVNRCFLCKKDKESIIHIFFHYEFPREVWSFFLPLLSTKWVFHHLMKLFIESWSNYPFSHNVIVDLQNQVPPFVTQGMWKERDNRTFREVDRSSNEVCMAIKTQIKENLEVGRYSFSKVWPNYKEMKIKHIWGISKDLTNLNQTKMLTRISIVWKPPRKYWIK